MRKKRIKLIMVTLIPLIIVLGISFYVQISDGWLIAIYLLLFGVFSEVLLKQQQISQYDKRTICKHMIIVFFGGLISLLALIFIKVSYGKVLSEMKLTFIEELMAIIIAIDVVYIFNKGITLFKIINGKTRKED